PQPGDLIEIDRPFHQHWALYMGDGYVINLTPAGKEKVKVVKQKGLSKVALFIRTVKKQRLKKVVRHNKWRVNNKSDKCQTPLPVKEIIQRAEAYMSKEVTYCSIGRNCEHFVKKLRYGETFFEQVSATGGAPG
ncbi:HRSL1 enzyme, partial [Leucopsar rothschildi]|nr:HRSL1 enzyme [Leucopsar rothschildi]